MLKIVNDVKPLPEPFWIADTEHQFMRDAHDHPDLWVVLQALECLREHWRRMRDLASQATDARIREALAGRYGLADAGDDAALDIRAAGWDWHDER